MGSPPFAFPSGGLRLPGLGLTLFTFSDNPTGQISGSQPGDLCVTTEPGLYQWSADATPVWVAISGFDGAFSGVSGIGLGDTSIEGIAIVEEGSGNVSVGSTSTGVVSVFNNSTGLTVANGWFEFLGGSQTINLFTSAANPNGTIVGVATGDLCVSAEPALYQWNAGLATPAWVGISAFDGNFSGTTGINLTDTSTGGLYLYQNNGNNVGIGLFDGEIAFETNGGEWVFNTNGSTTLPANGEMEPISLFTNGGNPNGSFPGAAQGDLCLTGEPALYQWNPNLATPVWEQVGSDAGSVANYVWTIGSASPYFIGGGMTKAGTTILDGIALTGGVQDLITIPALTYAPGATIMNSHAASVTGIPASSDSFDLNLIVCIVSLDGTSSIVAQWFNSGAPGTASLDLSSTDPAEPTIVGDDLVFQDNGSITTTAGGIYGITAHITVAWD